jgi:hypothetical protein
MSAFLIWLVRLLILLVIVRLIYRSVRALGVGTSVSGGEPRVPERAGTLVRDPHCGTYVLQSRAIVAGDGDDARYFCSAECRDAWLTARRVARAKA